MLAREAPPGEWSWTDDTAMALSIVELLERNGAVQQDHLAGLFARRYIAEPARGYGAGAHGILQGIGRGGDWRMLSRGAFGGTGSFGNGAAMRVAPLGAFFAGDLERVVREARHSAEVTHAHPEGIAGGIAIAVGAALLTDGCDRLLEEVLPHVPDSITRHSIEAAAALPLDAEPHLAAMRLGNGSHISAQDTVAFTLWCAARHADDYEAAMWTTASCFGDVDTTCAIVGGLVACRVGLDGLPAGWLARREPLPSLE